MSGSIDGSVLSSSEARLWRLIQERTEPGADVEAIDRRIWDLFGQRWAIVFTDLAGFSRNTDKFGILHFLQVIYEHQRVLFPIVERHDGILVKVEADSLMLLFKRPLVAVRCAVEMQRACQRANQRRNAEEQMLLCVGVGYGDLLRLGDHDVYGREVNVASKLGEDTAKADEILISDAVRLELGADAPWSFEPIDVAVPGSERNHRLGYPRET